MRPSCQAAHVCGSSVLHDPGEADVSPAAVRGLPAGRGDHVAHALAALLGPHPGVCLLLREQRVQASRQLGLRGGCHASSSARVATTAAGALGSGLVVMAPRKHRTRTATAARGVRLWTVRGP